MLIDEDAVLQFNSNEKQKIKNIQASLHTTL